MPEPTRAATENKLIGTILAGRYELLEVLGSGGMGVVYKARQTQLDLLVAVKLLHFPETDFLALKRLKQEAKALAAVDHPAVPKIHCIEQSKDHGIFLAMDYVGGDSLDSILRKRGSLTPESSRRIFLQLTEALSHAHRKGVIHRDIKPSNIMISEKDGSEQAHLLDFGVAKLVQSSQHFTASGGIVGTAQYMSPEQAMSAEIDGRSDVYSLGCLLYETLCGKSLYAAESAMEMIMKHVHDTLPPLETREFGEFVPVLLRALAKEPAERFQSMKEFHDALIEPSTLPTGGLTRKRKRTSKIPYAIMCGAVLVSVVVAGVMAFANWKTNQDASRMSELDLLNQLKKGDLLQELDAETIRALYEAEHNKNLGPKGGAEALNWAAIVCEHHQRSADAERLWLASLDLYRVAHNSPTGSLAGLINLYERKGHTAKGIKLLEVAVKMDSESGLFDAGQASKTVILLAQAYSRNKQHSKALEQYLRLANVSPDKNFFEYTRGMLGVAGEQEKMKKTNEAKKTLDKWFAEDAAQGKTLNAGFYKAEATNMLARMDNAQGDLPKATAHFEEAIAQAQRAKDNLVITGHAQDEERRRALFVQMASASQQLSRIYMKRIPPDSKKAEWYASRATEWSQKGSEKADEKEEAKQKAINPWLKKMRKFYNDGAW